MEGRFDSWVTAVHYVEIGPDDEISTVNKRVFGVGTRLEWRPRHSRSVEDWTDIVVVHGDLSE